MYSLRKVKCNRCHNMVSRFITIHKYDIWFCHECVNYILEKEGIDTRVYTHTMGIKT